MANVKLDFSKMKHISSDDHTTTLKHPDGHEIRLTHKALSPDNQKALAALAQLSQQAQTPMQTQENAQQKPMSEGGKVKGPANPKLAEATKKPMPAPMPNQSQIPTRAYAKGGMTPAPSINSNQMAEGGEADETQDGAGAVGSKIARAVHASPTPYEITNKPRSYIDDNGAAAASPAGADAAFQQHIQQQEQASAQQEAAQTAQEQAQIASQGYRQMNAEGGDVSDMFQQPKPLGKPQENKLNYKEMKPPKKQGGTLEYDKLQKEYREKNKMAEGGKVAKYCMYCGGMAHGGECEVQDQDNSRKQYADPDAPVSDDDSAPTANTDNSTVAEKATPNYQDPMQATQQPPVAPEKQLTPEQKRTREIYNAEMANPSRGKFATPYDTNPNQFGPKGEPPQNFSASNWNQAVQQEAQEKQQNAADIAGQQQKIIQENQARVQAGLDPLPIPNVPDGQQIPGSSQAPDAGRMPDQAPMPQQILPQSPDALSQSMQDTYGMMKQGYQNTMAGMQQEAAAKGALGQAQANALQQQINAKTNALASYQKEYGDLSKERQAFIQDYQNGHIDPEKYWKGDENGNGGHSKIAAALGMIMAGFNPTNKPNAAIDFLKYQMDQNINAQSKNLEAKNNLLRANYLQFGNARDAMNMTQIMQNDMMQARISQEIAKAQTPMAKAALNQAKGQLQMEMAPKFQQFAMQRAMMNMANTGDGNPGAIEHMIGYMRVVNPEMAKDIESRYVPGVGLSPSQPIPNDVRQQLIAKQNLNNLANDLLNYSSTHTNLVPGSPEYNTGAAKAFNLKQLYREAQLGGILRQGEMPLLDKVLEANPAGVFKELSTIPKLKEMINLNSQSLNTLKRGYGLPETKIQQQPVMRKTRDGRTALFDPETKQFLGYK